MVRLILNILWLVLGGIWSAIAWFFVGILCAITIIGLPWARSCFMLANYTLWPFGRDVIAEQNNPVGAILTGCNSHFVPCLAYGKRFA